MVFRDFGLQDQRGMQQFQTDEWLDFLDNYEQCESYLQKYHAGDQMALKWVCITLFMSLQSLFVVTLKGTNHANVTENFATKKSWKFRRVFDLGADKIRLPPGTTNEIEIASHCGENRNKQLAQVRNHIALTDNDWADIWSEFDRLLKFWTLFNRTVCSCKSEHNCLLPFVRSKPVPKHASWHEALTQLHRLRDRFIHFSPAYFAHLGDPVPGMIGPCLDLMIAVLRSGRTYNETESLAVADRIASIRDSLASQK